MQLTHWHGRCIPFFTNPIKPGSAMDMNYNFEPVYPHHDLLMEIGEIELAMADAMGREESPADLEARLSSLLEALDHLAV
jgi:hypothetical protein